MDNENDAEDVLEQLVEINNHLLELQHAPHLVVLEAVAILDEDERIGSVRTGMIRDVNNRITTDDRERHQIETSLKALYGEDEERGFVDRRPARTGNAYDWFVTEKGRELLTFLYELGVIDELAESDLTDV